MAQPTYNDVDHGQQSWDADLQGNIDSMRTRVIVPEYANYAALPAAAANDHCLASTTDNHMLWISNGSIWLPASGGTLNSQTADDVVTNVTTTEQDSFSYTLPAGTLSKNGDELVVEADFTGSVNTDGQKLKLYLDGTEIGFALESEVSGQCTLRARITRRGASGVGSTRYKVLGKNFTSAGNVAVGGDHYTSNEQAVDWTATVVLKLTMSDLADNADTATVHQFHIELKPFGQ